MDKSTKKQLSLVCFLAGFVLLLAQDLKGISSINPGFAWPFPTMFYAGLILIVIGALPAWVTPRAWTADILIFSLYGEPASTAQRRRPCSRDYPVSFLFI